MNEFKEVELINILGSEIRPLCEDIGNTAEAGYIIERIIKKLSDEGFIQAPNGSPRR